MNVLGFPRVLGMPVGVGRSVGALTYIDNALAVSSANILAFWPLNETSGTVAVNADNPGTRDGVHAGGVTLAGGEIQDIAVASYDGSDDRTNVYSASLAAAFTPALITLSAWFQVSAAGDWTDGATRRIVSLVADANNYLILQRGAGNRTIQALYTAGGTVKITTFTFSDPAPLTPVHLAFVVNVAGNSAQLYVNNVAQTALTSLGTWVGALATTTTVIGNLNSNGTGTQDWKGLLGLVGLWNAALNASEVGILAAA